LAVKICKGLRPELSEDIPVLLEDLIKKCWDAKAENRPTAKELCQLLRKWNSIFDSSDDEYSINREIYSQVKESDKIRRDKLKNNPNKNKNKSKNIQKHPKALYTSKLLNFKNLPEPVNSSYLPGSI
jgi:methylthioribose-1-phosphate isomerase